MNPKNKITLSIIGIIIVLLITIGISYAYFSANLTGGEETTTITVTGGTMNIIYNGGANINVANIIPNDNPAATKTFTVTGNNTTDVPMEYKLSLIVEENTFSEEALKYKLISTNTDNNGNIVPSFPDVSYNQNEDQGKEIKAYIEITNYEVNPITLKDAILAQGGGADVIEEKPTPDFSVINGISGIYATEDDYGTSYYYRGEKNLLNNNLIFGGFQWKIIRINGDGSIRILYNGTEDEFDTNGTVNTTGISTQIGSSE